MKNLLLATAVLIALLLAPTAEAASNVQSAGKFGIGVQVGYPIEGISANWFMTDSTSLQFGLALWLNENWTGIGGRVDHLFWMPKIANWDWGSLGW